MAELHEWKAAQNFDKHFGVCNSESGQKMMKGPPCNKLGVVSLVALHDVLNMLAKGTIDPHSLTLLHSYKKCEQICSCTKPICRNYTRSCLQMMPYCIIVCLLTSNG